MKEEVYCKYCQFYVDDYACSYPDNIYFVDCFRERVRRYKEAPISLNENNDCKWFKRDTRGENYESL
jgi:hypothetical protein